jgi:hypothetical protein
MKGHFQNHLPPLWESRHWRSWYRVIAGLTRIISPDGNHVPIGIRADLRETGIINQPVRVAGFGRIRIAAPGNNEDEDDRCKTYKVLKFHNGTPSNFN